MLLPRDLAASCCQRTLQVSFTSGNRQRRPWLDSPQNCLKSQLVRKGSNHMSYITRVRSYTCPVSRLPCVKRVLSHTCTETRLSHLVSLLYCATSVLSNAYKRFTPDCVTPKMWHLSCVILIQTWLSPTSALCHNDCTVPNLCNDFLCHTCPMSRLY